MTNSKFLKRRVIAISLAISVLVGLGTLAYVNRSAIRTGFEQIQGNDYVGTGKGEVIIEILPGETGEDVARALVDSGVVKNYRTTYKLILEQNPTFFPGTYKLKLEMSSLAALAALADPQNTVVNRVTVKEGLRISVVFKVLSEATGISEKDFKEAAENLSAFDLPEEAPSLEGYLFPATYNFSPKADATSILKTMRERMQQELDSFGVSAKDTHRVLTLAGLVQKEARIEADFYKASRTFLNRIEVGMKLQSDATVSYGVNGDTVSTSSADRANDNGYNTYLHPGLPIGPIGAPGRVAIDAALNPAVGKWLYFCTINLETGETVFSETFAEHEKAVALWQAWMKEHPEYD
jgi:UPF0755 protein